MKNFLTGSFCKDLSAIIFLIFCSFVFLSNLFWGNQIFAGQDLGQGDITHSAYPVKDFYSQQLKAGKLPLWMGSISMGYPLLADAGVGTFYLPNLISYIFFPSSTAFNVYYLFAFIIASVGMYFYARSKNISRFACILASLVYTFSFVFIGQIIHINVLHVIALFPWLILASDKFFSTGSRICWLLFVFIFSQMFLAGFPQSFFYAGIAVFAIAFLGHRKNPKFIPRVISLILACIFVLGLVAIQLLPTVELFNQSTRSSASINNFQHPFTLKDLVYFVAPYFWGDPSKATYSRNPAEGLFWENNIYAGILPFVLLIISFFLVRKRKQIKPYTVLFFSSLIFSLGWLFFLNYLPIFSGFRLPQRMLFLTMFSYAMLAGFGFDYLISYLRKKIVKKSLIYLFCVGIVVVAFIDVFFHGYGYNGGFAKKEWLKVPETAKFLQQEKISGRVLSLGAVDNWHYVYNNISHGWIGENGAKLLATRALLSPDANALYGISSFGGYAMFAVQNNSFAEQLAMQGDIINNNIVEFSTSSAKLLGMYGVEYLISLWNIESKSDDLELVWKKYNNQTQSTYFIYKNMQFLPKIRSVAEVHSANSVQQMANNLVSPSFDPKTTAYIYGVNPSFSFPDEVLITNIYENDQEINFRTESKGNSFIVIAESYYPGWKAKIDGSESEIYQVNINSRGVSVPVGTHNIKMFYDPDSFKNGKIISFASVLIGLVVLFWPFFRKFKPNIA